MKRFALVMAGGRGERLWPLSTKERPKQLIPLIEGKSLLDMAVERASRVAEPIILTGKHIANRLRHGDIKIIVEPLPKNTAPALIYATYKLHIEYGNILIAALPSDHYIKPLEKFEADVQKAFKFAMETGNIITFGIKPGYPHTGYGYIERGEKVDGSVYKVVKFHEKPTFEKAKEYLSLGNYYWNSGMFVWESGSFLNEVEKLSPDIFSLLNLTVEEFFEKVESISIDYAVMEKTKRILVLEASFDWKDIGSYRSIYEIFKKDKYGNAYKNDEPFALDSRGNLIISDKKVILIGVENMAIVESGNRIMILNLDRDQDVREVARKFEQ